MSQLGRISGKLLSDNLVRHGVDLALDNDLLYLKVSSGNIGIGINTDNPIFSVDVNSEIKSLAVLSEAATFDNITFSQPATIGTVTGPVNLFATGSNPVAIFEVLQAGNIKFNDNVIENIVPNENLTIDANGTGNIQLQDNTVVTGDLSVSGNTVISGDLSTTSNIIIGDNPLDKVIFGTEISQDINPGRTLTYNLGSASRRWSEAYVSDWTQIANILPSSARVSAAMFLGSVSNSISTLETSQQILINPDVNAITIENMRFQDNSIRNLLNTPLTLATTGTGYYQFAGNNGVVLPSGTTSQRPSAPNVGDTRWNTDLQLLECFDGNVYLTSIGPGDVVEVEDMEDLGNIYTLMLG